MGKRGNPDISNTFRATDDRSDIGQCIPATVYKYKPGHDIDAVYKLLNNHAIHQGLSIAGINMAWLESKWFQMAHLSVYIPHRRYNLVM